MKRWILPFCLLTLTLCGCGQDAVPAALPGTAPVTSESTTAAMTTEAPTTGAPATAPPIRTVPPEGLLPDGLEAEVYEEITIGMLLADCDLTLSEPDMLLDTLTLGEKTLPVCYASDGIRYQHEISYTVSDRTAPVLTKDGDGAEVVCGKAFDLNEYVGYADRCDPMPQLSWTGVVDTGICGSYPIRATVTDASGNSTSWDLTVQVVPQKTKVKDDLPRLPFGDFMQQYAGDNVCFGIDVSKWQGEIDFAAVKQAGCEFVIMRVGRFTGDYALDEYFFRNMANARAAGLKVGVYLYSTANTEDEIRENAAFIAAQLSGQALDFPVVFDWESFDRFQQYGISTYELNRLYDLFAEEMAKHGYDTMLYSSRNNMGKIWEERDEPLWLAHYTSATDYEGDYAMWQMSCRGRIPGITGDVDLDLLYTDRMH